MAKCSDKKNPLQRNGTAQKERLLPGLQKGYVNVDEKTFADWIVFAKEFAGYLHYYELNGAKSGDWVSFFSDNVSAVPGTITVQDTDSYKRNIKQRFDFLKKDDYADQLPAAERKLDELFSALISFCAALDEFCRLLPADVNLKNGIENLIKTNLSPALQRMLRYYKAAKHLGYLKPGNVDDWKILGSPVQEIQTFITGNGLSNLWFGFSAASSWNDYVDNYVKKDESIFGDDALDLYFKSLYNVTTDYTEAQWLQCMKMNHAANHNLFAGVFDQFLMAHSKLVADAEKELQQSLEKRNTHPAHYALFLAFLRLFRFAQNDLNTITQRHLDFYYKEVLQLKQKSAQPNSVHVLAELAKPVNEFILEKDTLFKAGKDSEKKDVLYGLTNETSFNKAAVKSLRAVYIGTAADDDMIGSSFNGRMFAAPIMNSADGAGAELTTESKEWHPFANKMYVNGDVADIKMPLAEIGFAVASHYLYLQEGERKIMLRLSTDGNAALKNKHYAVYLTTEKEWYKVASTVTVDTNNHLNKGTEPCVEFSFTLTGDEPAITNYSAKVHGGTLNVNVPVMKIVLLNDETVSYDYNALRDVRIEKIEVAVEVGMSTSSYNQQGLKQLLVSTDGGVVDVSKPFQPFGSQPRKDATLVIGNKELFSKKNASVKLNIEWGGITDFSPSNIDFDSTGDYYPYTRFCFLQGGLWNLQNSSLNIFNSNNSHVQVFSSAQAIPAHAIVDYNEEYLPYNSASVKGYMRFVLDGTFGHKEYLKAQSIYLINKANEITPNPEPTEPYTPVIQSLYISYSAYSDVVLINQSTKNEFDHKTVSLFHLYPFGDAEQHAYLTKESFHYLLPQFMHINEADDKPVQHEAEFYIGFEHLSGKQAVNVLFQVMDGSADPTISKPDEHIQWSYLSNNQWINFQKQEISDATMQMIQSGIISFIIPADATTVNTILPAGYLWIKASVAEKSEAVCKLLSVNAQAAVAMFQDKQNAADFLNTALPPATISKLKDPLAAVKKITQPYSSFGGRALENSDAFYVRVSERLRHKARAITIWDYEHLILEAFPLIHKVKCLNHTKSEDADYNEVIPGHVTIITIPDLQRRNDINPLKPYTDQATLKSVEKFLKKRISCHVQLHVVNPVFEEVQLKFKLKLAKGYDDFTIYSNKLKEEITAFLSPWAYSTGDIGFGGDVYKSVLINFIEERPYVDFITDVLLCHYDDKKNIISADSDHIIATTAKSILVSVPAAKHEIEEIKIQPANEQYECAMIAEKNDSKK